jgi:hypothetical protein
VASKWRRWQESVHGITAWHSSSVLQSLIIVKCDNSRFQKIFDLLNLHFPILGTFLDWEDPCDLNQVQASLLVKILRIPTKTMNQGTGYKCLVSTKLNGMLCIQRYLVYALNAAIFLNNAVVTMLQRHCLGLPLKHSRTLLTYQSASSL